MTTPRREYISIPGGNERGVLAAILILTALVYARSLGSEFILEHRAMIVLNPHLGDWEFVRKSLVNDEWWFIDPSHVPVSAYYRPFMNIWMALNYRLFGENPVGWRAAMIAVHMLTAWLVFRVGIRLTNDTAAALIATGLFALSPLNAEAVVGSFATPLCAAFELGAFDFNLRLGDTHRLRTQLAALGLFACALMSYEAAITLPVLIAVHDFLFQNLTAKDHATLADRARKVLDATMPYAIVAGIYLGLRFWILGAIGRSNDLQSHMSAAQAALSIPNALWTYVILLATPWQAGPAHQVEYAAAVTDPSFWIPATGLAALSCGVFVLLCRHRHRRLYAMCIAWFMISLAPMLNLNGVATSDPIHDRYLYFASIGLFMAAGDLIVASFRDIQIKTEALLGGAAIAVLGLSALLFSVQGYWHDDVAVYSRITEVFPNAMIWHRRMGIALEERGELKDAQWQFELAIRFAPNAVDPLHDLAIVDERLGDRRGAARAMATWVQRLGHPSPVDYASLAEAADAAGDASAAENALEQAEAMPKGAQAAALARARIRFLHGDRKGAEDALRSALRKDPYDAPALAALGTVLSADGRVAEALAAYQRAAALAPPGTLQLHYKIAVALHQLGRDREARDECAMEIAAEPANANARGLMDAIERGLAAN